MKTASTIISDKFWNKAEQRRRYFAVSLFVKTVPKSNRIRLDLSEHVNALELTVSEAMQLRDFLNKVLA